MMDQNTKIFWQEIQQFFFTYFSKFSLYSPPYPNSPYVYYYNYRAYSLSIVVFLPLIKDRDGELKMTSRSVQIALKKTNDTKVPYLIDLTDTLLTESWEDRIRERIGVLRELITEVHKCGTCGVYKIPRISRTNNVKRTMFVSLQCPTCHKYTSTIFGRGLKTRLHRNLKRIRSK